MHPVARPCRNRPHRMIVRSILFTMATAAVSIGGCPLPTPVPDNIDGDAEFQTFEVAAGRTVTVQNNAVITVRGDATIDGEVAATSGRLTLIVEGALTLNGTLRAVDAGVDELDDDTPLDQQPTGLYIVAGAGAFTLGETAVLETNGAYVITDDATVLSRTPGEAFDEVEDVADDDPPTFVPLPPDNPALTSKPRAAKPLLTAQAAMLPPVTIGGTWPPAGSAPPGDRPVVIFRVNGPRDLILDGWTFNGPDAPDRPDVDQSADPGRNASGRSGRNGIRLNIWNNGGAINIVNNVAINLPDGGDGGDATSVCATANGGDGGRSGNLRITATGGISISGTLAINPGRSGHGGEATVTKGAAGAAGCPGAAGADATANGGDGGDNRKAILVRGNVTGVANIAIGDLIAGNGGPATASACDGGPGTVCCDGGPGGDATSTGGAGGEASLNLRGLAIAAGAVTGGAGGTATATGGNGGAGGDCKFADAGDGGPGGDSNATGGKGGDASATGGGVPTPGRGGDATATAGDGGPGGDSGFGDPGSGGDPGDAMATEGEGGATGGASGNPTTNDGDMGDPGGALAVVVYCIDFGFVVDDNGAVAPGVQTGSVRDVQTNDELGSVMVEFVEGGDQYRKQDQPVPHIGVSGGTLIVHVSSLQLAQGEPGVVGGLQIVPLLGGEATVRALDAEGNVIGTETFAALPTNEGNPSNPTQAANAVFNVDASVDRFAIDVPANSFTTIIRLYLLDP